MLMAIKLKKIKNKDINMQEGAPIVSVLERFVDTYKAMEKIKITSSIYHMALIVEMYRNRKSLELRLHENTLDMEKKKV
jgi:hypothetical protein